MGLSASQARLLNLTARMHDIEYKAQNLEAQKLQMANESTQVYQEYENALNKQKVQFKQIGADGSANYVDASIYTLINAGYQIKILNGNDWYEYTGTTSDIKATTGKSTAGNWLLFKNESEEITITTAPTKNYGAGAVVTLDSVKYKAAQNIAKGATKASVYKQDTTNIKTDKQTKLSNINLRDFEVLRNLVEAGFIVFEKPNSDGGFDEVNIATDTNLQEVSDPVELKKAEAKYEADMRKIDAKDKKFDTDLAAIDNERNAIKTEMDTLKTVAKENVDRTFKLFS